VKHFSATRTVSREDLRTAPVYRQVFQEKDPERFPGSTAIGTSTTILNRLKAGQQTSMGYAEPDLGGASLTSCSLDRKEAHPVPFSILLNNHRVNLPSVHAEFAGHTVNGEGQKVTRYFYSLDDSDNPLVLSWDLGKAIGKLRITNISFPGGSLTATAGTSGNSVGGIETGSPGAGNGGASAGAAGVAAEEFPEIKQSLEQTGHAEVYGIYFEFGKATIREESEPVLRQIAEIMHQNPTWKLSVDGHTDSIGGDAYNVDLSQRRAEAVKVALVERYHVTASRLNTSGYGASRPKETNDTIEGRARNRRVELVRQ
jgi:outer membrane protein OmpA-like peptidoglycan-associated protein